MLAHANYLHNGSGVNIQVEQICGSVGRGVAAVDVIAATKVQEEASHFLHDWGLLELRSQPHDLGHFLVDETHEPAAEDHLTAGSWVYGTFSTWIGDPDKNRAWELLIEAKRSFDEVVASGTLTEEELEAAELQLAVCEGSDWFWWFGDYNPSSTVEQFDQLFRIHLANLYHMLRIEAPPYLTDVISRGGGRPTRGGVMRHHNENGESH